MFAINHAATALIIKKIFKDVPIIWILISVQFMELLWVFLNYLGIEKTTTEKQVKYVGNIHLSYMPFSHSIATMAGTSEYQLEPGLVVRYKFDIRFFMS